MDICHESEICKNVTVDSFIMLTDILRFHNHASEHWNEHRISVFADQNMTDLSQRKPASTMITYDSYGAQASNKTHSLYQIKNKCYYLVNIALCRP